MNINIDGLNLEYTEQGTGVPVLLLHGWNSSYDVYRGIMNSLCSKCHFVALNFPGCGNSDRMKTPWNIDDYCDLVIKFIKCLNLENPILIGHSHGGRVILKLCADRRISPPKIVLIDSAGIIPKKTFKQNLRLKSFKAIKNIAMLPIVNKHSESIINKARKHYGSTDYNAAPEVLRKTMVSLVNTDLRDIIHNISCPTLLIWGENDKDTPLADGQLINKLIPDSGLCVIKGTGHFSFCEHPFEASAILNSFLN